MMSLRIGAYARPSVVCIRALITANVLRRTCFSLWLFVSTLPRCNAAHSAHLAVCIFFALASLAECSLYDGEPSVVDLTAATFQVGAKTLDA